MNKTKFNDEKLLERVKNMVSKINKSPEKNLLEQNKTRTIIHFKKRINCPKHLRSKNNTFVNGEAVINNASI